MHYQMRDMILEMTDKQLGDIHMPGIVPKLSETPGKVAWTGPELGEHNDEIYKGWLHFSEEEYAAFQEKGII